MADYLIQLSYSTAGWATLIKHPENRVEVVRRVVENLGGKLGTFWFSFGDYDLVGIFEMPDNVSVAAFAMAIAAGGACSNVKTTPLIGVEEGMQAMKKAGTCGYKSMTAGA